MLCGGPVSIEATYDALRRYAWCETRWKQCHITGDPMAVGSEKSRDLYVLRVFGQPIIDLLQKAIRSVGREDAQLINGQSIVLCH